MNGNTFNLPTTPVLDCLVDRLFHDIDRFEFRAFERNEPVGYFHDMAQGYVNAAITLGLRKANIGPEVPS